MASVVVQTLIQVIFMGPLDAFNHLLNLFAPAAALAGLLVLGGRLCLQECKSPYTLLFQVVLQLLLGSAVLAAGLVLWGRDGKMLTYAALVLAGGSCQWWLQRGWRSSPSSKK